MGGLDDYYEYTADYTIYFYSDKACTIRTSLVYPRNVTYLQERHVCNSYGKLTKYETYHTITIPAGSSSFSLAQVHNVELSTMGAPARVNKTMFYVLK